MKKLLQLLEPKAVRLDLEARDANEIVSILGESLFDAGYVLETFVEAALTRESELPTGLPLAGDYNAAIPHTDIEHVLKPGLALATLTKPVVFHNMVNPEEEVPVQLVILMALDEAKAQVEMLQEIASVLQNSQVITRIMQAQDFHEVQVVLSET
jgi:PTS system galactitol-specific IIA component